MIDRKKFFDAIKATLFGSMQQHQVEGVDKIITYWEGNPNNKDLRHLAYMFATVFHETATTMQPISEGGGVAYLKSKKYYPYYGRGLVQLTWDFNYKLMTMIMRNMFPEDTIDFKQNPDQVMDWKYALPIMFEGMRRGSSSRGDFTGKALEDYFNDKVNDPKGARRIINGTDQDDKIAGYHNHFLRALVNSYQADEDDKGVVVPPVEDEDEELKTITEQMLRAEEIMETFLGALPNHPELAQARLKMIEARLWMMEYERRYGNAVS